jgi:hypothetical protein
MPRTLDTFLAKWNNASVIDQTNKQILFFGDPTQDTLTAGDRNAWLDIMLWPKFTLGGTLLEGNVSMVELTAKGIAENVRSLSITN